MIWKFQINDFLEFLLKQILKYNEMFEKHRTWTQNEFNILAIDIIGVL